MKVLAFCPTYRLEPETWCALLHYRAQVARGEVEGTCSFDILLTTDNPEPYVLKTDGGDEGRSNTLHNYRKGRRMALEGGYDRIFILESDMVPPPDALQKLSRLMERADVAYGLYAFRPRPPEKLEGHFLVTNVYERPGRKGQSYAPGSVPNIGSSLSLKGNRYNLALKEGIVPCSGGGLGIVLMTREVLERVDFRDKGRKGAFCDVYFNRDVWRAGFEQWADMSVVCGHKMPDGRTIWPPHTNRFDKDMAYRAIRGFSGPGVGTYNPGDPVDDVRAPQWAAAGLCEEVEDDTDLSTLTKAELYEMASEKDIAGRSKMDKDELIKALS